MGKKKQNKALVITDLHWGFKNSSKPFHDYFELFYTDIFFPYLDEQKIDTVILGGDCVEYRKFINYYGLNRMRRVLMEPLQERGVRVIVCLGNHDLAYKHRSDLNAMDELFGHMDNVEIYQDFATVEINGYDPIDIIPWMHAGNIDITLSGIENSTSDMAVGHLDINGFRMNRGHISEQGLDRSIFSRYDTVLSGHYHHRNNDGNIFYMGSPYEMTWHDVDDSRGMHVIDLETREVEFIENPHRMFYRLTWDNGCDVDPSVLTAKTVKIVVVAKDDEKEFDKFLKSVYDAEPLKVDLLDSLLTENAEIEDLNDDIEDTLAIIEQYVDGVVATDDAGEIKKLFRKIHVHACDLSGLS